MDIPRTLTEKPKAVRNLLDYYSYDKLDDCNLKEDSDNMGCYEHKNGFKIPETTSLFNKQRLRNSNSKTIGSSQSPSISDADETNSESTQSDSASLTENAQSSEHSFYRIMNGVLSNKGSPINQMLHYLPPPIGVFWDIENCQVPKGRSAVLIAQAIREKFFQGYREAEFLVVCDVRKENAQVIQELNDAQVNLVHVASVSKNAADDKLRQSMRRFADIHGSPSAIILISGDVNFSSDLSDLRHRKKIHVILVHNDLCSQSLILCANEHYNYTEMVETLPLRGCESNHNVPVEVVVTNLPTGFDPGKIRNRLKRLSENCGGRVGVISDQATTIRFPSVEMALRAQKRMNNESVYGCAVNIGSPYPVGGSKQQQPQQQQQLDTTKSKNNNQPSFSSGRRRVWNLEEESNYHPEEETMFNYASSNMNLCNGHKQGPESVFPPIGQRAYLPPLRSGLLSNRFSAYQNRFQSSNQENVLNTSIPPPPWSLWNTPNKSLVNGNYHNGSKSRSALSTYNGNSFSHVTSVNGNNSAEFTCYSISQLNTYDNKCDSRSPPIRILKRGASAAPSLSNSSVNSSQGPAEAQSEVTPLLKFGTCRRSIQTNFSNGSSSSERYFHPISAGNNSNAAQNNHNNSVTSQNQPVELHVTNLDQSIEPAEMKKTLLNLIKEYSQVIHIAVFTQSDGNNAASVKLPSFQDAQVVISQLHRKKIGYKRIVMSFSHSGPVQNPSIIRLQTVSLLLDVPGNQLPLFKFRELFEKRYFTTVSVSDLYKMKDVCTIGSGSSSGRIISLHPDHRNSPSPVLLHSPLDSNLPPEQPYCATHWKPSRVNSGKGWAELEISALPSILVSLKEFSIRIHSLIRSHNNYLLLASLSDCYEAEFDTFPYAAEEDGVPLEHMVTCISGVELVQNISTGVKYLSTSEHLSSSEDKRSDIGSQSSMDSVKGGASGIVNPSLSNNLALFSRELVDLLKTFPRCMMSFNRFIPSYHHHFGRQCRVADYGYTKLIDLLEALPLIVQVLGEGNRKYITLSHRAQVRRFTSDLLRVLKSLPNKQSLVSEFPLLFFKTLNKSFRAIDYGLGSLDDLLSQVSENTIVMNTVEHNNCKDVIISIPKREQTAEEIERTKIFATEVIELLSHAPQCSMLFDRFIPAYHHHYGHQCRVSDFGFTKLIELFEAIPDVVKVEDDLEDDRRVSLTDNIKLKVLGNQLTSLVMVHQPGGLLLSDLLPAFLWQYGFSLKPPSYGFNSVEDLVQNLQSYIKVVNTSKGEMLQTVDKKQLKFLSLKVLRVLMECSNTGRMNFRSFRLAFQSLFHESCNLEKLENSLTDTVTVIRSSSGIIDDVIVQLLPIQLFARDVYRLLLSGDGRLPLNNFDSAFLRAYGTAVQPALFGHQSLVSLLQAIPHTVHLRGKPPKRFLLLNNELSYVGIQMPRSFNSCIYQNNFNNSNLRNGTCTPVDEDSSSSTYLRKTTDSYDSNDQTVVNTLKNFEGDNGNNSDSENIPRIILPNMVLHPDTFTSTPLTSPHKSLHNTVMFAEHMLHAPTSQIIAPTVDKIPFPSLLIEKSDEKQQLLTGFEEQQQQDYPSLCNPAAENAVNQQKIVRSISEPICANDSAVISTGKRKSRLAAYFPNRVDV